MPGLTLSSPLGWGWRSQSLPHGGASALHCPLPLAGPPGHAAQALNLSAVLLNEGARAVDEWMRALLTLTHPTPRPEEMFWSVKAEEPPSDQPAPLWGGAGSQQAGDGVLYWVPPCFMGSL